MLSHLEGLAVAVEKVEWMAPQVRLSATLSQLTGTLRLLGEGTRQAAEFPTHWWRLRCLYIYKV